MNRQKKKETEERLSSQNPYSGKQRILFRSNFKQVRNAVSIRSELGIKLKLSQTAES